MLANKIPSLVQRLNGPIIKFRAGGEGNGLHAQGHSLKYAAGCAGVHDIPTHIEAPIYAGDHKIIFLLQAEYGVADANVRVVDRGALDCVIRERVETAILRAKEN